MLTGASSQRPDLRDLRQASSRLERVGDRARKAATRACTWSLNGIGEPSDESKVKDALKAVQAASSHDQPAAGAAGELRQPAGRRHPDAGPVRHPGELGAILLYLWFRFGSWTFGLAAVLCLIHDLFFTLGVIAVCHYLHGTSRPGDLLWSQDFKIDLPSVAALLTLVGYSVNDTIVVFDRIREVAARTRT